MGRRRREGRGRREEEGSEEERGEVREETRGERSEGESPIFLCELDTIIQCISSCFKKPGYKPMQRWKCEQGNVYFGILFRPVASSSPRGV